MKSRSCRATPRSSPIFAGGNDVNTIGATIRSGAGGGDPWSFIDQQVQAFGAEYATMLTRIKERAPAARIVVVNLPNFAAIPMTAGFTLEERQMMQKLSVGISTQVINPLTAQGLPVVDLLCNSQFASASIFSADGFHPERQRLRGARGRDDEGDSRHRRHHARLQLRADGSRPGTVEHARQQAACRESRVLGHNCIRRPCVHCLLTPTG